MIIVFQPHHLFLDLLSIAINRKIALMLPVKHLIGSINNIHCTRLYLCFISLLYLDLCVLGDDALMS